MYKKTNNFAFVDAQNTPHCSKNSQDPTTTLSILLIGIGDFWRRNEKAYTRTEPHGNLFVKIYR